MQNMDNDPESRDFFNTVFCTYFAPVNVENRAKKGPCKKNGPLVQKMSVSRISVISYNSQIFDKILDM